MSFSSGHEQKRHKDADTHVRLVRGGSGGTGDVEEETSVRYTKIANDRTALADSTSSWDCVMDHDNSLMWEVKTNDGGLRDKSWAYMNNTVINSPTNWDPIIDGEHDYGTCEASNSSSDGITCDTEGYIAEVNSNGGICDYTDWRLPSEEELASLLTCSDYPNCGTGPHINHSYFPNTQNYWYWSSSPYADRNDYASFVSFHNGYVYNLNKGNHYPVRLVRDSN